MHSFPLSMWREVGGEAQLSLHPCYGGDEKCIALLNIIARHKKWFASLFYKNGTPTAFCNYY